MLNRYLVEDAKSFITKETLKLYTCPDCGFSFDAAHTIDDQEGGYICPVCEVDSVREENRTLKNDLKEINQCVDSFYTKQEPRRLHNAPLSAFSGQIQVMDKVSSLKDK
ncbi:hypothetical protein CHH61_19120 [Shouchella clausii]|uniref:Uncharacterized protein n=1 Tax=Shouchella clausii TaxID=79880 RepID=A0A268RXE5_SHOCL|nr:hypothetical protein [Shouchella clausii]PAF24406.1 hypothetical protein CHH61_19120 [Shouchella clausii]